MPVEFIKKEEEEKKEAQKEQKPAPQWPESEGSFHFLREIWEGHYFYVLMGIFIAVMALLYDPALLFVILLAETLFGFFIWVFSKKW